MYYKFRRTVKKIIRALLCLWAFIVCFSIVPRETYALEDVINQNDNGQVEMVTFNYSRPIVWKNGISPGGSYSVTMRNQNSNWLRYNFTTYSFIDIVYTTDYGDGFVSVEGYNGVFASGRYTPVCTTASVSGDLVTCVLQVPLIRNNNLLNCNGIDSTSTCTTDNPSFTFYNWASSNAQVNIYGAFFTNNFTTDSRYKMDLILDAVRNINTSDISSKLDSVNSSVNNVNNSINNSDTTESQNSANSLFTDFSDDDYGLSDIITLPLNFISSLLNSSCSPLVLPLPFVNSNLTLPCMSTIYGQYFGSFFTIYQIITTAMISYWVCVRVYALVKSFKDPQDDKIEVIDL